MALRRRGGIWWIDFYCPNGQRVRRSTGTADKNLAQELHDRLKAESWRIDKLGERTRRTWNEAVVRWLKESGHKATLETDKAHLRWLDRYLGGKYLDEISRALVDRITDARLAEGVSNATVNRTLEVLRAILRKCVHEWEWLDRAPRVRMLKEPTRRVRFLTREEADRLLAELPAHLADMAAFSLATGLRRANVTGLEWTQVDLERRLAWVHPDQAKARKAIAVPLNAEAVVIIRRQTGKHPTRVFSYQGRADSSGQHEGVVRGARARRHHRLSLARPSAHLGKLARAERNAAARAPGAGRLGECGDGASICSLFSGAFGALCGSTVRVAARDGKCFGHKSVTGHKS